jgi:hypothetical protein
MFNGRITPDTFICLLKINKADFSQSQNMPDRKSINCRPIYNCINCSPDKKVKHRLTGQAGHKIVSLFDGANT